MDLQDWKWTIINWINCVSSRNVIDLIDLEDGDVFSSLIREFRTEKSSNVKKFKTPFRHVKKFLRDEYPAFVLFDSSDLFTHEEALFVGSLLLHYCCIVCKDANEKYKDKMSNLQGTHQTNIVEYLKNMMEKESITREAIANSVPLMDVQCSPSASSLTPPTPNQEKYTGQLDRLKEQLKNSQSEVYYLEESTKSATEKCKQLVLERDKLLAETKNLKAELATLNSEIRSPKAVLQKEETGLVKLQDEVNIKNKLIEHLQNDIELLQKGKHELEMKMISMVQDIQLLKEKALKLEHANCDLQNALEDKEVDYQQLSEICNEQSLTIEQLKEIKQIDQSVDSIDLSMSQLPPEVQSRFTEYENLAHSVVDVQLREKEEQVRLLQESLEEAKIELDQITSDNGILLTENELYKKEHEKQKQEKKNLQAELEKSTECIKSKDDKIEMIKKALSDTDMELQTSIHKIEHLEKLNTEVVERITSTEAALADRVQNLQTIIGQDLDSFPELSIENSLTLLNQIITKVQFSADLNNQLNNQAAMLKSELDDKSEHILQIQQLSTLCEAERDSISLELHHSKKQVEELIQLNEQFKLDMEQLNLVKNEHENQLKELETKKREIEQQQTCSELEIQRLNDEIAAKNIVISELESSKINLIAKCNENNLQLTELTASLNNNSAEIKRLLEEKEQLTESHSTLRNDFHELKLVCDSKIADFIKLQESSNQEIRHLTDVITQLNNENKDLAEKSKLMEQQHISEKEELCEKVAVSQQKILELEAFTSRLECNMEILSKTTKSYENTIQNLQKEIGDFNEFKKNTDTNVQEYLRQTEVFSKEVHELNNKVHIYENTISDLTSDISVLTDKLNKCESEKNEISLEIQKHLDNSVSLEQKLKESISECNIFAGNLQKAELELEKAQQQQTNIVEAWQKKVGEKDEDILKLEHSVDSLQETISNLNSDINKLNMGMTKICELKNDNVEIQREVDALQNKCTENEKRIEELQCEKDVLISEHSKVMYEKDKQIDVYMKNVDEIKMQLSKEVSQSEDLTTKLNQNNDQILKLEQHNSNLSLKIENLTSIINMKDKNVLDLEQKCEHYMDQLNSANTQIEQLSSKTELLNNEMIEIQGQLNSKTSVCQNLGKEMSVIEVKNNELSEELTVTLQELKNIRKSYEDKIKEHNELLQKTKQNLMLCEEQYAKDNEDLHKKYNELKISNENTVKELQSQIVDLTKDNEIEKLKCLEMENLLKIEKCDKENLIGNENTVKELQTQIVDLTKDKEIQKVKLLEMEDLLNIEKCNKEKLISYENSIKDLQRQIVDLTKDNEVDKVKLLEMEDLLKIEKCDKDKLSSMISTFENDRCFIQENHDKLQTTILAINDIFKSVEKHTDLEISQPSNLEDMSKLDTPNLFSRNISQIHLDLKSIQNLLSSFVVSYKLLWDISKEKSELENKYDSLKLESEKIDLEHKHKIEEAQLCNKVLNHKNQHLNDFVHAAKELCRNNSETKNLMQTAFSDLKEKLDKTEELKIENLRSSKIELQAQIDKLVELKHNAKTNFTELAELNISLHKKLKSVNRRSNKYTDALCRKQELEKHFNRLSSHNITLIEKIVSQLLSFMDESREIANLDITDIVNTIQYILNDARIVKEQCMELETSIKDFIEDTSSSHETDYSNDQIEVYTPISSTPSGYGGRQIRKTAIQTSLDTNTNTKFESLKADYENLSISHESVSKELVELKVRFNNVQKELQEVSEMQKHEEIINENLKLQKQLSGLFKQVEDQSNEILAVRKKNEDLKQEVDLIDKKYSMAKIKYLEFDEMKSKHIENLKKQLADSSDIDDKVEQKVRIVRNEYEGKLEKMKNKMKELYNNEMAKLDKKVQEEKSGLEGLCAKYTDKIKSFESHVAHLSNELFEMSAKYVAEKNERTSLENELLKIQQQQSLRSRSNSTLANGAANHADRRATMPRMLYKGNKDGDPGYVDVIEETVTTTKRSVKPLSSVGSNIYMEDEEEVFNNTYLMDLQAGRCEIPGRRASVRSCENLSSNDDSGTKRLSELKWRNSLCPPHLRSSYATETQLEEFRENDVRAMDTSSAQLIPSDLGKATSSRFPKDRGTGTSYRKPGPPTPSKHGGRNSIGGRNSLASNELPRDVLKERNENKTSGAVKKAKATTPNRIKAMFMSNKNGPGADENESSSPKKRLSLFKRPRS